MFVVEDFVSSDLEEIAQKCFLSYKVRVSSSREYLVICIIAEKLSVCLSVPSVCKNATVYMWAERQNLWNAAHQLVKKRMKIRTKMVATEMC